MLVPLVVIAIVVFVVWIIYGRGAYIVYKYTQDEGVEIPSDMDRDQVMEALKKNLNYKDAKEIFFDEDGEICIAGKYDTYTVNVTDGRVYLNDSLYAEIYEGGGAAFSSLQKLGRFRLRTRHKKDRSRVEELLCIRAYITKAFNHNAPVNAHRKYTEMTRARKYSGLATAVCVILAVILCVTAVSRGMSDQTIDSVKDAYFESYSTSISIGKAFDDFFADPTWETYENNGIEYVKFAGECYYDDTIVLVVVTFEFLELDWFRISNITINGNSLSDYEKEELLTVVFDSYGQ